MTTPPPAVHNLAFLGVTHPHAAAWADAAQAAPQARITRVYDPDVRAATTFAERYRAEVCATVDDALRDVDAVVVEARNDQAAEFSTHALKANKPVFIEKTGARTAAQLSDVADRAARSGAITQMGYFMRYSDSVTAAQSALNGGDLGTLYLARFHAAIPHSAWTTMTHWFADASNVVTPFMEAGCHLIDVVRLLLGEPQDIRAIRRRMPDSTSPAEDVLAATMLIGETVVTIDFTAHEADPWNISWGGELLGDRETLRFGILPSRTYRSSPNALPRLEGHIPQTDPEQIHHQMTRENEQLMARGMTAFLEALDGTAPSPVDAASGAHTLQLIEDILTATELPSIRPLTTTTMNAR